MSNLLRQITALLRLAATRLAAGQPVILQLAPRGAPLFRVRPGLAVVDVVAW